MGWALCAGFSLALATVGAAVEPGERVISPRPAQPARLAAQSLLTDIASAGANLRPGAQARLVAVGERGHILTSDDGGQHWSQAQRVPVQSLLTGVCFFDAKRGVAVGHDETILSTHDAGDTWSLVHYAPEKQQPLLDVTCGEGGHAIAVGAYSAFYESRDGGNTWSPRVPPLVATPVSTTSNNDDDIPQDYHFNRIIAASGTRLYIAAEAGHLYRSDDAGANWIALPSPYDGSFFGALALPQDEVLVFGLRGNLFRSTDAGGAWQRIETRTTAMLNDGVRLSNNRIVIVGLSGVVLTSDDDGRTFGLHELPDRKGLSSVWPATPSGLAVVGEGGARIVQVDATREAGIDRSSSDPRTPSAAPLAHRTR